MAPRRKQRTPTREQPRRAAKSIRLRTVHVPEMIKARAETHTNIKKEESIKPKANSNTRKRKTKPSSPKKKNKKRSPYVRLGSMDSLLLDPSGDPLARQDRWIPELGQRPQIMIQPSTSLLAPELWTAYCALDDYVYAQAVADLPLDGLNGHYSSLRRGQRRQPSECPASMDRTLWNTYRMLESWVYRASLSAEDVIRYPLVDEVMGYQCDGGDVPPVAPEGWRWEEQDLVQVDCNAQ